MDSAEGVNALEPSIVSEFHSKVVTAVNAVNGFPGQYDLICCAKSSLVNGGWVNVSPYLIGWIVGTYWSPSTVLKTNTIGVVNFNPSSQLVVSSIEV
jgi:hypothetical protein